MNLFEQEFPEQPPRDEKFERAFLLWCEYHRDCEAYDRIVCTGPEGRDGIMPANGRERMAINRHAASKRRALDIEASDIPRGTVLKAKLAVQRLSHKGVLEALEASGR